MLPQIVALFKIHGIKRMDVCIYKEPMLTDLPYRNEYERLTKQMEAEQGAYNIIFSNDRLPYRVCSGTLSLMISRQRFHNPT